MQAQSQSQSQSQSHSNRVWKSTAFGGVLLSALGFYEPMKDVYLKVYDPDYEGIVSVPFAEHQLKLADRNAECFVEMQRTKVQVSPDVAISYGACANNNVHIGVYPKNKAAYQRWLEPNREEDLARVAGGGLFPAFAGFAGSAPAPMSVAPALTNAQVALRTVCQDRLAQDNRRLVRITDEGGQCYFERVNILSGVIEIREPVACDAQCDVTAQNYTGK